jgi:hypothetical protein
MTTRFLAPLLAALVLLVPSTAGAAIVHAQSDASGLGHELAWTLDYDTASRALTVDVTHTRNDGSPAISDPPLAVLVMVQPNGQQRPFNLNSTAVTLGVADGFADGTVVQPLVASSDGLPGVLNKGPQTYNIPGGLRVSANRAGLIDFRTLYTPPGG